MPFKEINPNQMAGNVFDLIGNRWMLITAGDSRKFNTMTASWGGMGVLWSSPVTFCFVRPQRYTLEFLKKCDSYTLSFFDEKYRDALNFCGSKSGRDYDKVKETGLTPAFIDDTVYFDEASLVVVCKKIYMGKFDPEKFLDQDIEKCYPKQDYHYTFIGKIKKMLEK